ncbi:MAG: CpaF family protein [Candidatus Sumerlaeia bacterium]|nr:CpaF family protein [Candidatus Sumerlaeia bacterium]
MSGEANGSGAAHRPTMRDLLSRVHVRVPEYRIRRAGDRQISALSREGDTVRTESRSLGRAAYLSVKSQLHGRLLDALDKQKLLESSEDRIKAFVQEFVAKSLDTTELALNEAERRRLAEDLVEETLGVGPLAPLMADPAVADILVVGPFDVYIERFGRLEKTSVRFQDAAHLTRLIQRIASSLGRRIDESRPMVDARLADGSRVNATIPPVSIDGPTMSIRRFGRTRLRGKDLLRLGMYNEDIQRFLAAAVRARRNILVCGGSGAGKSTFLGVMAEAIPDDERIITIEDAAELVLDQEHVIRFETRPSNIEGRGEISMRDLLVNSLRMRPDRIVVGEVRSGEALDMLQAMNTGHDGSMATIHANTPKDALSRLETMVLMAGIDLPSRAIREQIGAALNLIVHVRRFEDGVRRLESVAEVTGFDGMAINTREVFRFHRRGMIDRRVVGDFEPTGYTPMCQTDFDLRQLDVPKEIYTRREVESPT